MIIEDMLKVLQSSEYFCRRSAGLLEREEAVVERHTTRLQLARLLVVVDAGAKVGVTYCLKER